MRRWAEPCLALVVLVVHACIQSHLAWDDAETIDEPGHVGAALTYTRRGTFRLYNVNPPLSRVVQGVFLLDLPLDLSALREPGPGARHELGVGGQFRDEHDDYRFILWRARLGSVAFALLAGLLVRHWANLVFGPPCGLVALVVWCADPMVLAHGHLVSPDVPAAAMAFAAALAFRHYLLTPSVATAALAAFVLGLALLTKFTLVLLCGVWLLVFLGAYAIHAPGVRLRHAALVAGVVLLTLNAGYLFQDTGRRLETFRFGSTKLAPFTPETIDSVGGPTNALGGTWLGAIPVPLPAPMLEGIDLQAKDFDEYRNQNAAFFMAGTWNPGGRYDYYVYGLLVKTPLAVFGLLIVGVVMAGRKLWSIDGVLLIAVPVAVLLLVSSQKSMNKHVRYVLPMLPFVAVLCGAAGRALLARRVLVVVLLLWLLAAAVRATRDPMAYFNEAVGGPRGGIDHLAGSNLDWGQSRHRLRAWLEAHPDFRPVGVAVYSTGWQLLRGLDVTLPPAEPTPGRYIISARVMQGDAVGSSDGDGHDRASDKKAFTYFRRLTPIAVIGDSVYVFEVTAEDVERLKGGG